jgi:hypothetical protein
MVAAKEQSRAEPEKHYVRPGTPAKAALLVRKQAPKAGPYLPGREQAVKIAQRMQQLLKHGVPPRVRDLRHGSGQLGTSKYASSGATSAC